VTVVDPATVTFVLKQKFAPFLTTGLGAVYIMPKKAITDSFTKLQGTAASSAAAVATEDKKVQDALAADACSSAKPADHLRCGNLRCRDRAAPDGRRGQAPRQERL